MLHYSVFVLAVARHAVSHTMRIFCSVSFLEVWCLPVRSRSWYVLEALLLRHAVRAVLVFFRMGLAVVFLGVLDCGVSGIALSVGVGRRFLAFLALFLVV